MFILRHLRVLTLALVLCIGPSATSQGIAWFGMLFTNVPELGLIEGFSQTFDGEHPCALCQSIQAHDDQETERATEEDRRDHFRTSRASTYSAYLQIDCTNAQTAYHACITQCSLNLINKPPIHS